MPYVKLFDPDSGAPATPAPTRLGDRPEAGVVAAPYEYSPDIVLAVNVALAAGRPLLVRGGPGTGKSSLARAVAEHLHWRYYATTVSSRSTARDLQWGFDTVARLADAQAGKSFVRPPAAYLTPGVLWWAFDRVSAQRRGVPAGKPMPKDVPLAVDPQEKVAADGAVVLIDEIDKADPDVPNDLLRPLGSFQIEVDGRFVVSATAAPLVIITTNEERDLPKAFLRRCVVLALKQPNRVRLLAIAKLHNPQVPPAQLETVIDAYLTVRRARREAGEVPPSVAELLDAVAAGTELKLPTGGPDWPGLVTLLLAKPPAQAEDDEEPEDAPQAADPPP